MSEEDKAIRRDFVRTNKPGWMQLSTSQVEYEANPKICVTCDGPIPYDVERRRCPRRITCSESCKKIRHRETMFQVNKGSGGRRVGSGRGRKGMYNGIWCDSTYELAFVIHSLALGHTISRYQGFIEYLDPETNQLRKYYPDFIVNGQVVEVKGYLTNRDRAKLDAAPFMIRLVMGPDLKEAFEYIEKEKGVTRSNLHSLYQ